MAEQLGHRINGVIQESQLISWYQAAFSEQRAESLGSRVLRHLRREFDDEFPFCSSEYRANFLEFYRERGYDQISRPEDGCVFYEDDPF
ncbi:hypothetical protein HRbin15_00810 [bacterium HR15]|nr:hypothetical protein HRbin15_00810 [bacterium HR15]